MRVIYGQPNYNYRSGTYSFRLTTFTKEHTMYATIRWPDPIYEGTEGQDASMKRVR